MVTTPFNFREWIARMTGTERNLWKVFGYPQNIGAEDYWRRYRRGGIASRIIRAYPDACWSGLPIIQDEQGSSPKEDQDDFSAFTAAFEELNNATNALAYLARADRLCRTGHYSILVLGFAGNQSLSQPMVGYGDLLYLSPYAEHSVKIVEWETQPTDPRFGLPKLYEVTPSRTEARGSRGVQSFRVHHTRVIHIAENCDEDDVFGEPALRPIWNNLLDLEKVTGSGAETFWLNARGGLSVTANPDAKLSDRALADMKQQMDDYERELRRTVALQGASVNPINTAVSDPKSNVDIQLTQISGTTGIPGRILTGSERGELASSEDANSWEARVGERRQSHCSPYILKPFIIRMIETGNLPEPIGEFQIQWPDSAALSPEKQATIAVQRITAASTWANGMADRIVSREEVRVMIGLPPESEYDLEEEGDDGDSLGEGEDGQDAPGTLPTPPGGGGDSGEGDDDEEPPGS